MKQKRTAEDYLKTIHILSRHGEVRGTHIADVLGVSRATVSLTLKALEQEGYLLRMADHAVRLTDSGRKSRRQHTRATGFSARCLRDGACGQSGKLCRAAAAPARKQTRRRTNQ